jgi:hypothetical protein
MSYTQEYYQELFVVPMAVELNEPDYGNLTKARLLSRSRQGLEVIFELTVEKVEGQFSLLIPWTVEVRCPNCYGPGRSFTQLDQGSSQLAVICPRCGAVGKLEKASPIVINVTPAMAADGEIKLVGAGVYDPRTVRRGDLTLRLNFVESLRPWH